ncbi:neocarzinostatin apoprotein domain-containing protein [Nocardia huaxiensis]|uniref:Neocarzinostatin family protein n=1 Tax=Nocardia huaxiensis TaxID=2755382 RepID=A0A7D6ZU69_9NOCA|nr:neocarzinostatin apoprotein domain-containing protein [Nocardia huaxiensis]QLY28789.1 hypothetical protein H0264_26125 [Nocardia huaxiensis]UFS97735.1 hypothetical protein LPY97_07475 [Nocardia huaxiensis]
MKTLISQRLARTSALVAVAGAAALAGSPAAMAEPTLTLSVSTGVTAGQTVTVQLEGLPPDLPTVAVGQCKPQITTPADCNLGGSLMGRSDAQGMWQPNGGSRTLTLVASIGGVDCAAAPGACTVAVTSLTNPSDILASVPLDFGAKQPAAPSTVAAESPDSDADDSNSGVLIGIAAAVVVLVAVVAVLFVRRRG